MVFAEKVHEKTETFLVVITKQKEKFVLNKMFMLKKVENIKFNLKKIFRLNLIEYE